MKPKNSKFHEDENLSALRPETCKIERMFL